MYRLLRYDLPVHFLLLITNWLPDIVKVLRFRGWLISPFLGSCGKGLKLGRNITLYNPKNIHIGADVYIAYGCWFTAADDIRIEDEVLVGPYSVFASSNHTRINGSYRHGEREKGPIVIGKGSWIGAHSSVLQNVKVGKGSLIAANSVVNKSFADNTIAGGVPAKIIKELSDA